MLELHNISKSFGPETPVLKRASLRIAEGQVVALVGPSGCGKTTLLRIVAGLETADSGTVKLNGNTVANHTTWVRPEKRPIGIVFQDGALFPHMTVSKNVAYGLHKMPREERVLRVEELLEIARMREHAGKFPSQLSGGEQQRIALIRALAPRPKLLLLDEPFSHLDADLRKELRRETRKILESLGMTVLLVTHDQEDAAALGASSIHTVAELEQETHPAGCA